MKLSRLSSQRSFDTAALIFVLASQGLGGCAEPDPGASDSDDEDLATSELYRIRRDAGSNKPATNADAGMTMPTPAKDAGAGMVMPPASTNPTTNTWTRCSDEFSNCTFNGLRDVRITTADGRSTVAEFYQQVLCNVSNFGSDPAPGVSKHCEYGPQKMTTLAMPSSMMATQIDLTQIPLGSRGYSVDRVQPNSEPPVPDTIGAFRTVCSMSHMGFDDPIVFPGKPGSSHLHVFFGNTLTNASSTADSLATSGNGTCRGGTVNRTAYWVPAVIDTRTHKVVEPLEGDFYYKTGYRGIAPSAVQALPKGLRMIAGSANSTGPQDMANWGCLDGSLTGPAIQNCAAGQQIQMTVIFPQCWDGKNLDSSDHKSHMAYANGTCPSTHPVPLPELTFNIRYKVEEANAPTYWRLASDMYDTSLPGGYSAHADWFGGWKEDIMNTFIKNCDDKSVDCHSNLLGDGREIF